MNVLYFQMNAQMYEYKKISKVLVVLNLILFDFYVVYHLPLVFEYPVIHTEMDLVYKKNTKNKFFLFFWRINYFSINRSIFLFRTTQHVDADRC
jgi:hypothetical protein